MSRASPVRASCRVVSAALCALVLMLAAGCGGDPPEAGFSAAPTSGEAPVTVTFTDTSSGEPESWAWDFGDGGSSAEQSPTHVYEEPGSYTVILTVTNGEGSDDLVEQDLITATAPPLSAFCQSVEDLGDTIGRLADPATLTGGVEGLTAALGEVKVAVEQVRTTGGEEYGDEIAKVENAVAAVSGLVESLQGGESLQGSLGELATAGLEVTAAVTALRSATAQGCEP
jgi:PKD repeat protein